jgi:methylphosphotriester-DNA--protein-cysteine methyltransferase
MRLAERALREGNTPVSVLAGQLGYTSESAFSNAFKRITGNAETIPNRSLRRVRQLSIIEITRHHRSRPLFPSPRKGEDRR